MIPEKAFTNTFKALDTMENEADEFTGPIVFSIRQMIRAIYDAGKKVTIHEEN